MPRLSSLQNSLPHKHTTGGTHPSFHQVLQSLCCQGMTYFFTIINHFTRWPEAIPLPDFHASLCAATLVHHWISRFGVLEDIASDRGRQFTSTLWTECNRLLGIEPHTTTAYHPQANGIVDAFIVNSSQNSKPALPAPTSMQNCPWSSWGFAPLGSRIPVVPLLNLSMAQLFVCLQPPDASTMEPDSAFLKCLRHIMRSMQPTAPKFHGGQSVYIPSNLASTGFCHVWNDAHRHPLHNLCIMALTTSSMMVTSFSL